jgi:hypothetical protein
MLRFCSLSRGITALAFLFLTTVCKAEEGMVTDVSGGSLRRHHHRERPPWRSKRESARPVEKTTGYSIEGTR